MFASPRHLIPVGRVEFVCKLFAGGNAPSDIARCEDRVLLCDAADWPSEPRLLRRHPR